MGNLRGLKPSDYSLILHRGKVDMDKQAWSLLPK